MASHAWKAHERAVAKHFCTEREKRGADFSVSDCDVLVNIEDWYGCRQYHETSDYTHIVVECKYKSDLKLHDWMREFSREIGIPMDRLDMLLWYKETKSIFK